MKSRTISVFGLGYVGSVTAACLAHRGNTVIGCDVAAGKVDQINRGEAPISEPGLAEQIKSGHKAGRLSATTDATRAIAESEISLICVGTPSQASGALDLRYVESVSSEIATALRDKAPGDQPHAVIFRSTMLPGSTRRMAETHFAELLDSGRVEIFFYPEFLRQGSALDDFENPSLSAIGQLHDAQNVEALAALLDAEAAIVNLETAELLKYACNAFHAAKVSFANEIGRIGKASGVDSAAVMELLCRDERLNISPYYLRPGTPFGGSCLPKDVSALNRHARSLNVDTPTLDSLLTSNRAHLDHLIERIEARGDRREVTLLGLAFKPGTDDLRGSAMLELATQLLLKNYRVRIYDPEVAPANLIGANERFAALKLPQLEELLDRDLGAAIGAGSTLVVSKKCAAIDDLNRLLTGDHHLIDVARWPELETLPASYEGICW